MPERYDAPAIEKKWQKKWGETGLYHVVEDPDKRKYYALVMFPYTSAHLHLRPRRPPRALQAHAGLQRDGAHRLRRLWASSRKRRHQVAHTSAHLDHAQRRADARPVTLHRHDVRLGARGRYVSA